MKLNLAIDQGNSAAKISLFDGLQLLESKRYDNLRIEDLQYIFDNHKIGCAIYSSVQNDDKAIVDFIKGHVETFTELSHSTPLPIKLRYATPTTLGHDRIATAVGAYCETTGCNLLIIDAGTAVTFDIVNKNGEFLGGNISPGLKIRFSALNNFTDKLPLMDSNGDIPLVGYDTSTAIRAGVINGLVQEIDGYINDVNKEFGELKVFMTGGDAHFLAKRIKSRIFEDENLLTKGLNRILLYNNESI